MAVLTYDMTLRRAALHIARMNIDDEHMHSSIYQVTLAHFWDVEMHMSLFRHFAEDDCGYGYISILPWHVAE